MKGEYSRVLDDSSHSRLDESIHSEIIDYDEDDVVEIILNEGENGKDEQGISLETKSLSKLGLGNLSSIWSTLTFSWVHPMLELGNSRPLEQKDLFELHYSDSAKGVYSCFQDVWKDVVKSNRKSLVYTYFVAFGKPFMAAGLLKLFHDCCLFLGPYYLKAIIHFLNDPSLSLSTGLSYVAGLFFANLAMSICLRQYFFWCFRVGMRLRSCVITSVYHKSLKLSSSVLDRRSTGEITNLMALDSTRLQELTPYLHAVWYSLFQIGLALYFLWQLIGSSCIGGVVVIIVCIPITGRIAAYLKKTQSKLSEMRDKRVKQTNEVLAGMKVIKLQAWESEFEKRLNDIRREEMNLFFNYGLMQSVSSTFSSSIPLVVALVTFFIFIQTGGELTLSVALPSLALFELLRFPLYMLPTVLNNLIEANVALTRIRNFLIEIEKVTVKQTPLVHSGVLMSKCTAVWDSGVRLSDQSQLLAKNSSLWRKLTICGGNGRAGVWSKIRQCWPLRHLLNDEGRSVSTNGKSDLDRVMSGLTEEEFEILLVKAQLSDALSWIDVLEGQIAAAGRTEAVTDSTALLKEGGVEGDGRGYAEGGRSVSSLSFASNGTVSVNGEDSSTTSRSRGSLSSEKSNTSAVSTSQADRLLTLARVSLSVTAGDIVALVGQVGCGKSSLFSALLGDMRVVAGHVAVRGRLAYVSQRPFIMHCSVRDNILFGAPYDEQRYRWTL